MELIPFFELLKRDPAVRKYIRSFIDYLERPYQNATKEKEKQKEDRWTTEQEYHDAMIEAGRIRNFTADLKVSSQSVENQRLRGFFGWVVKLTYYRGNSKITLCMPEREQPASGGLPEWENHL